MPIGIGTSRRVGQLPTAHTGPIEDDALRLFKVKLNWCRGPLLANNPAAKGARYVAEWTFYENEHVLGTWILRVLRHRCMRVPKRLTRRDVVGLVQF